MAEKGMPWVPEDHLHIPGPFMSLSKGHGVLAQGRRKTSDGMVLRNACQAYYVTRRARVQVLLPLYFGDYLLCVGWYITVCEGAPVLNSCI